MKTSDADVPPIVPVPFIVTVPAPLLKVPFAVKFWLTVIPLFVAVKVEAAFWMVKLPSTVSG